MRLFGKALFAGLGLCAAMTLSGCQMGQDAVVVQYPATTGQPISCWFLHNQAIHVEANGGVSWATLGFAPIKHHVGGHVAHVLDTVGGRLDFQSEARGLGVDPDRCENIR